MLLKPFIFTKKGSKKFVPYPEKLSHKNLSHTIGIHTIVTQKLKSSKKAKTTTKKKITTMNLGS